MPSVTSPSAEIVAGTDFLRRKDRQLRRVIDRVGACRLRPSRERFAMLVRSIISQQISTKAARSILGRLKAELAPRGFTAEGISSLTNQQLRAQGVSPQKLSYLQDLAARARDGRLRLSRIGRLTDEEIIEHLIQVKGIGRWTAQMFLIFSLNRLDVFPHDDLGVRMALRNLYGLDDLPNKEESHRIAKKWRPYASIPSWYCWRSLELKD